MARLITRASSTTSGRAALASMHSGANTPARMSSQRSHTPASGTENEDPTPRVNKGKGRMRDSARPPTPDSSEHAGSRSYKRRRISEELATPSMTVGAEDESEEEEEEEEEDGDDNEVVDVMSQQVARTRSRAPPRSQRQSSKTVRFYDPNQDETERRDVKRKSRALEREFNENRDDYMKTDNDGLTRTIEQADEIFEGVKQTADATTDSRLMVNVSDMTHRRSAQLVLGDTASGIDVDEFVSKCLSFMRRGAQQSTQRRTQREGESDDEEDGDILDWGYLGVHACHPFNSRPAVPSFLLGPLSVQKRVRAPTQRRARQRDDGRAETRPEALGREDIRTTENNTVKDLCVNIQRRLTQHCRQAEEAVSAEVDPEATEAEIEATFRKHRITSLGGPSLFDFVINPRSFGQTVENLFYVSFLIKEGECGVQMDEDGLPVLVENTESAKDAREQKRTKHQAVFGIDYATWQMLVQAYEIKDGLIPHRDEAERRVGARGWYT